MRDMPMSGLVLFVILGPLLELTVLPDLEWKQSRPGGRKPLTKLCVDSQQLSRFDNAAEEFPCDLRIHRRSHAHASHGAVGHLVSVFRRRGGAGHQMSFAVLHQII